MGKTYSTREFLQNRLFLTLVDFVKQSPEKLGDFKVPYGIALKEIIIQAVKGYNMTVKDEGDKLTLFQGKVISQ